MIQEIMVQVAAKPTSSSPATCQDGMSQVSRNNTSTWYYESTTPGIIREDRLLVVFFNK